MVLLFRFGVATAQIYCSFFGSYNGKFDVMVNLMCQFFLKKRCGSYPLKHHISVARKRAGGTGNI